MSERAFILENSFGTPAIGGGVVQIPILEEAFLGGSWLNRRQLTIDSADIDSKLTNFPILINLSGTRISWDKVNANGSDIRFYTNENDFCQYEIVTWNTTGSLAEIWVQVPSVESTSNTKLWMYYNFISGVAPGSDFAGSVWDNNFVYVGHFNSDATDSTSTNTMTVAGALISGGFIGSGYAFDGTDDIIYDNVATGLTQSDSGRTIEGFGKLGSVSVAGNNHLVTTASGAGYMFLAYLNDTPDQWGYQVVRDFDGSSVTVKGGGSGADTNWHHIAGAYVKDTSARLFIDGAEVGSSALGWSDNLDRVHGDYINVGAVRLANLSTVAELTGFADEVRISNVTRSDAWIKATYETGRDDLLTYGGEE